MAGSGRTQDHFTESHQERPEQEAGAYSSFPAMYRCVADGSAFCRAVETGAIKRPQGGRTGELAAPVHSEHRGIHFQGDRKPGFDYIAFPCRRLERHRRVRKQARRLDREPGSGAGAGGRCHRIWRRWPGGKAREASKAGSLQESVPEVAIKKARRKGPRPLCPVPGCKNPAAPVLRMVCANHKGIDEIKKYREQRRAKKLGLAGVRAASRKAPKKAKKRKPVASSPKPAPAAAATATA